MAPASRSGGLILVLTALLFFVRRTEGQVVGLGRCPQVTLAAGTAANSLSNTWFLVRKYYSTKEEPLRCFKYVFGAPQANNAVSVTATGTHPILPITANLQGTATPVNGFSTHSVFFAGRPFFPQNYKIIGLGPGWIVLWSCTDYALFHLQQVLILTTLQNPDANTITSALNAVRANSLPTWLLIAVDQSRCP